MPAGRLSDVELLDDYTGHVDPEGPAARRDLEAVTITKVSVGPMDNNAYVLVDKATGRTLLIDAANEADRLSTPSTRSAPATSSRTSSPPISTGTTSRRWRP